MNKNYVDNLAVWVGLVRKDNESNIDLYERILERRYALGISKFCTENTVDEIILELFQQRWTGDSVTSSLWNMKKQLYKNIRNQVDGYWTGHTAYHILVDGGFIVEGKSGTKKKLTKLGEQFMMEMNLIYGDE